MDTGKNADARLRRGDAATAREIVRAARERLDPDPWFDLVEGELGDGAAAARAAASADPEVRARGLLLLARGAGDSAQARALIAEALEVPGALRGADRLEADAALAATEEPPEVARIEAVVAELDALGDGPAAARVLAFLADQLTEPEAVDAALAAAERRVTEVDGLSVPLWEQRALLALRNREPARALLFGRRALSRIGAQDPAHRARAWSTVARAHALHGDLEGALVAWRRCAELFEVAGRPSAAARLDEAAVMIRLGRHAEAARHLSEHAASPGLPPTELAVRAALLALLATHGHDPGSLAQHLRRLGRWAPDPRARSARLLDPLIRLAERCADVAVQAGSAQSLARAVRVRALVLGLAEALGRDDDAVRSGRLLHDLGSRSAPLPAGPFDLLRKVGWGAVGDVWRGRHHEHRLPVAVKVLARRHDRPGMIPVFQAEVRAMAALDHPNVVRVLATGVLGPDAEAVSHGELRGGSPWFAMELAEAGTLDAVCGRLPWSGVRAILQSLLDALAHAHARGVVHLDLKPANALLRSGDDGRPTVLLTDFGLAKLAHADTTSNVVVGTPRTMAPEQFRGEVRDCGPWTDLYALGCVACELVTGHPAFPVGDDFALQRAAHLQAAWNGLQGARTVVPPGFDAWVATLLAKDPAARFQRAADAAHALSRLPDIPDGPVDPDTAAPPFRSRTYSLSLHDPDELERLDDPEDRGDDEDADDLELEPPPDQGAVGTERPRAPHRPPVPADWRPLVGRAPARDFVDVAPTLLGLAAVPVIGREPERDRLWAELVALSRGGPPRAVAIVGPPGIGRATLARWLCERAHELGVATVLDATPGDDGHRGLRGLVERHLRLIGLPAAAAMSRVRRALPDLPTPVADDLATLVVEHGFAQAGADRVAAVCAMVAHLAAGRPVIVRTRRGTPEDPDEALLRTLLLASGAPVLVLVEADEDGREADEDGRLALRPLADDEADALLDAVLPLVPPARRAVRRLAAGHPKALLQVVTALVDADALARTSEAWEPLPGVRPELPAAVLAEWAPRVQARASEAPPACRTALAAAALLGDRLDAGRLEVVVAGAGADPGAFRAAFGELLDGAGAWRHPAARILAADRLADLFAAEVAVSAVEARPEGCEVLRATLLVRAGRVLEAPDALLAAARRLVAEGDPDDALPLLDQRRSALAVRDPSGEERIPDALLRAEIAVARRRPDAASLATAALELAEAHAQPGARGEAHLLRAAAIAPGDPAAARLELRRASDAFAAGGNLVGTARALRAAAELALRMGDREQARSLLERALRRVGAKDRDGAAAEIRASLAHVARLGDDLDRAEAELASAMLALDGAPDAVHAAVLAVAADVARDRGDPGRAEALHRRALARVPWHEVERVRALQVGRALACLAGARVAEARRVLDGLPPSGAARLAQLAILARADDATFGALRAAVEPDLVGGDRDCGWLLELTALRAQADGRTERARAAFATARDVYARAGLARLASRVDDRAAALPAPTTGPLPGS